jgi:glyoxylase-like metal-dependent hydrolase (beta-lactamase superfamily II)
MLSWPDRSVQPAEGAVVLQEIAEGVLTHESRFVQSNGVVVQGAAGVLLIDPGVMSDEIERVADDVAALGRPVVGGFSTHPHWDHLLWHPRFGDAPRYATALCATTVQERLAGRVEDVAKAVGIPDDVSLHLIGEVSGVPEGTTEVPWDGQRIRIVEHRAHAPGHAALVLEDSRVLVAGDMLSDVLIPMLDVRAHDPIGDYLAALDLLEHALSDVDLVVPGHGFVCTADEARARLELDRTYVTTLRDGGVVTDPRIGPSARAGWEWVGGVHERQIGNLAA